MAGNTSHKWGEIGPPETGLVDPSYPRDQRMIGVCLKSPVPLSSSEGEPGSLGLLIYFRPFIYRGPISSHLFQDDVALGPPKQCLGRAFQVIR